MTDTLFVFVFLASVLAPVHGLKTTKLALFVVSGALLGVATLMRSVTIGPQASSRTGRLLSKSPISCYTIRRPSALTAPPGVG